MTKYRHFTPITFALTLCLTLEFQLGQQMQLNVIFLLVLRSDDPGFPVHKNIIKSSFLCGYNIHVLE